MPFYRRTHVILLLGISVVPVTFLLWSFATFGSVRVGVACLRGATVAAETPRLFAGRGKPGQQLRVLPSIVNLSNQALRVSGATKSCACLMTDQFPLELPPKQTLQIPIDIQLGDKSGEFSHQIVFYVETETQVPIMFIINGAVDAMTK